MLHFINNHKKTCTIAGTAIAALLLFAYLRALFLPGVWHRDAFLYRQADGSFCGSDFYAEYKMNITKAENGANITFAVNGTNGEYRVINEDGGKNVQIFENGVSVFKGSRVPMEGITLLQDENGDILDVVTVTVQNVPPETHELFPSYTQIYNLALMEKCDVRGNLYMPLVILLLAALLSVDIAFPDLFFHLRYGMAVYGGTPSDWYRSGQMLGRVLSAIGILVCVITSFTIH